MNDAALHRYVELETRRRSIESELKDIKAETEGLEKELLANFEQAAVSSVRHNGTTVYLHRQLWCSPKDGDYGATCAALRACGLGDLVQERFNTNTVSAYVRERDKAGEALPQPLSNSLNIAEVFSLRTRSS